MQACRRIILLKQARPCSKADAPSRSPTVNKIAWTMIAATSLVLCTNGHAGSAATPPERFVSSTLKFAMAALGRTTPGARLNQPLSASLSKQRQLHLRQPMALAMSVTLPGAPMQDALVAQTAVGSQPAVSTDPTRTVRPTVLAAWRLASIR
jgi:hypothetical protein